MRPSLLVVLGLAALPAVACAQEADTPSVTITASKDTVVRKVDKTVVDVATMARAQNGTAQDVLQSTPEVSVAADGRIAVRGNTNVTVLVDGKPSAMLAGDERAVALQTMNGADIASVEVITNPSAAYNANGGAIVNIVLKRQRQPGAHAQLRASAADQGLWNAGASGDVTSGKLSVNGSLAYRRDGTQKFRQSTVDWNNPQDGATGQARQTSSVFVRRIVHSAGLGVDYALSAADSLSLSAHYNQRRSRPWLDVLNTTGAEQTIFHRISTGPNEQSDHDASLAYTRQGQGSVLKAVLARSSTRTLVDKSYRDVYVEPLRASSDSRGATRAARQLDQATLDWTRAAESGQWGMGVDVQDEVNDLANYQATVDRAAGTETPDPATTNHYKVTTRLSAAYLTDKIRRGRWEVLLGGRLEHMALRITPAQGAPQTGRWQAFNPSLHGIYALNDRIDFTLGYRRSLQRPDPRDLNPFITYIDPQNLSRGNPGLQPQRLTSWEMGANVQAGKVNASVGAFHRVSRATVIEARSFTNDNVLVTSHQNGGRASSTGVSGSLDWTPSPSPLPALRLGLDGGAYAVQLDTPDLYGHVRQHDVAGYLKLRAVYRAGRDDLSLDAQWQSSSITPLGGHGATSSVNATWKRELSSTLSLTVNANDIFDGSRRTYRTDASTLRQRGIDHFVARRWYVGLVKKFGAG
ncbi:outer membrane receptor protein involved in Fe transport [Duganella sp. 3397]|uniref:TonB-dependent receptor n=1 Tax=Duganella sp. 3397 TaxID=2817732 RepID=UPI00285BF38F|nr:TonB-dependent receptor [Duganella sp. 3397]MDR7048006.1 outer membrane receptor protein involved in Fe transport [Duganella sp. 3397]